MNRRSRFWCTRQIVLKTFQATFTGCTKNFQVISSLICFPLLSFFIMIFLMISVCWPFHWKTSYILLIIFTQIFPFPYFVSRYNIFVTPFTCNTTFCGLLYPTFICSYAHPISNFASLIHWICVHQLVKYWIII